MNYLKISFLFLVLIACSFGTPKAEPTQVPLGWSFGVNAFDVRSPDEETGLIKPKDGHRFVVLDVTVQNLSGANENLSVMLQVRLKNSENREYSPNPMIKGDFPGSVPEGPFQPDEVKTGPIGFEIPLDAADGLSVVFQPDLAYTERLEVELR